MRRASLWAIIALVPFLAACQDHATEVADPDDLEVLKLSEDGETYPPFTELPVAVRVVRENGQAPVRDQIVNFVVTEGGGSVLCRRVLDFGPAWPTGIGGTGGERRRREVGVCHVHRNGGGARADSL